MVANPPTLPPPPMNLKTDPAFYRWLQTLYQLFSGAGGIDGSFINQSQIQLANLGEKSHQSLTDILPADQTSTDTTANKHTSNNQMQTVYNGISAAQSQATTALITAQGAQQSANNAQSTANANTTSINTLNGQVSNIESQISTINGQITAILSRLTTLEARNQVWSGPGSPTTGPLHANGDWYADLTGYHIWVQYNNGWIQIV